MSNFGIPQSINPVRYQASLGGNIKSTTVNNTSEQFQIELAIVKKVFYRKGTLLFSVINRGNSVSIVGNDTSSATASAPIPLESFGRNSDGKVFGGYRPVKVGSKIAVGYVNGERSAPIVLGVYPDNDESYEIVSPVSFETGEDSDKQIEDTVLGKKEITASQNIIYQSGKGDILKTFNGKSLLYINANGSNYMDDINYAYDQIADTRDGNMDPITPRETRAQSWLLVHEDNPEDENTNGHRTRFYVNKNGEFQMIMFSPNNDSDNNLVIFTASKDDGFKLRKQFDTDDLDNSGEYVQFSIGSGNTAVLQSVDKDDASEISMLPNGLALTTPNNGTMTFNGRSLENMFGSISSAVDAANAAGDKADKAANAGSTAQSAASEAASQALLASQAGEEAKQAAVDAQAAGEDAKNQSQDVKNRIIYYSSISQEKDVAIPGKYIIVNTDTYIKDGTIKTAHIGDAAITNAKIADLAVGTAQLEDAAITRAKIGNLAVGTAQIEDAAITDAKVGNLSADHLNAGTIDFSIISGIHINASEIDVGKIVADQIFVNGLGDISKNLGTVTSGNITGTNLNSDVATVTSQALAAQSTANSAKVAADSTYSYANSQMAVQSQATANAQSKADSAFNQAQTAIDNNQTTNAEITKLRNGSTMTIADLENGLATKVANSDYASYKVQTASQMAEKVANSDFETYQTQTADLIAQKVANSDFSAYQATTAKEISSKVESSDFNTYKTQTDGMIASKVSKKDANNVNLIPYSAYPNADNLQWTEAVSGGTLVATTHNFYHNGADSLYRLNTAGSSEVFAKSPRFKINANTTYTFQLKGFASSNVSSMDVFVLGRPNGSTSDFTIAQKIIDSAVLSSSALDYRTVTFTTGAIDEAYLRIDNNGSNNGAYSGLFFTELKMEPGDTATPYVYGAEDTMIAQMSDDILLRVTKGDLIDEINLQAGNTLISSSGQLTLSGKTIYFDTVNPVIIPSANIDSLLVNHSINNGNGTFTVDANGNVTASSLTVRGVTNLVYNAALLGGSGSSIPGWGLNGEPYYSDTVLFDGLPAITWNGDATGRWDNYANSKLQPVTQTGIPYSASIKFRDYGSASGMLYTFTLGFFSAYDANTRVGYLQQVYTANGSDSGIQTFTINNAIAPSNAKYVAIQLYAYNGKGHAAFSSPMLTQTAQSTGYQPDTGNIINAGTIIGSQFYGGSVINNSNNTAGYYPMSIDSLGTYNSTYIDSAVALRASIESGAILYNYRSMVANSGQYFYSNTVINGQGLTVDSGYTASKDTTFNSPSTETAYVSISTNGGLFLHGSDANIDFGGHLSDDETNVGMYMNPYGNIIGKSSSDYWQVSKQGADNTGGGATARFGIDTGGKGTINFYRPLFVDEIGAFTSSNGGALLVHDQKGTSQMVFRNDGNPQVVSASIYNRTYSSGSTVTITSYGTLGRITSASKYKLDITKETSISPANKLLSIDMSSWIDKSSAELLSDSKTNGTELSESEINVNRHYGLIAEDLIKAGLDEFVIKGDKGQAEGIEYDRLWTVLIPKIRDLSNKQIDDRMTINRLEQEVAKLKQEVASK